MTIFVTVVRGAEAQNFKFQKTVKASLAKINFILIFYKRSITLNNVMNSLMQSEIRDDSEGLLTSREVADVSVRPNVTSQMLVEIVLLRVALGAELALMGLRPSVSQHVSR